MSTSLKAEGNTPAFILGLPGEGGADSKEPAEEVHAEDEVPLLNFLGQPMPPQ